MRVSVLAELWGEKHPGGKVWRGERSGYFCVTYGPTPSKVYYYRASSVYRLAERLECIPEVSIVEIADRVEKQLENVGDSAIDLAGASDTLAHRFGAGFYVDWEDVGSDEWGRVLVRYTLQSAENDPWMC